MNGGQIVALIWDVAVWFFVISVLVLPAMYAQWRHREKEEQRETEEVLNSLLHDRTHQYEQDAM